MDNTDRVRKQSNEYKVNGNESVAYFLVDRFRPSFHANLANGHVKNVVDDVVTAYAVA